MKDNKNRITWIFSALLSLDYFVGRQVYINHQIDDLFSNAYSLGVIVIKTALLSILIHFLIEKTIIKWIQNNQQISFKDQNLSKKMRMVCLFLFWAGIFLSWFPAFLAYYPGIFSYDAHTQTRIVLELIENSRFHPPLHTLMWEVCINIENKAGIPALVIYSVSQMLLLSFVFAQMLLIIVLQQPCVLFSVFSAGFIMLNPVMAIMSLPVTKDIPFTAALTALIIKLFQMEKNSEEFFGNLRNSIILIALCTVACLLRNNMIYVLILSFILIIVKKREYRKELAAVFIISVYGYLLINGPVYDRMGVESGNPGEALSVPIQQISRTVIENGEKLSEKEKQVIDYFLPFDSIESLYNPRFADPVKSKFKSQYFSTHKKEFADLWIQLFKKYPAAYINAFLDLNIPYWYIGASSVDPYSKRAFIETANYKLDFYNAERTSRAPALLNYYELFASYSLFANKSAYMAMVYSIALPIWLILFCITVMIRLDRRRFIICFLPYLFLWVTYMAGPVSNFRYIFPIYTAYPFFLFLAVFHRESA